MIKTFRANVRYVLSTFVRFSGYVIMYGFALNVNTDLNYFNYISSCSFVTKGITSIEREIGKSALFDEMKNFVIRNFQLVFGT